MFRVSVVEFAPETRLVLKAGAVPVILYQKLLAGGVPGVLVRVNVTVCPAPVVTLKGEMPEIVGLAMTVNEAIPLVAEP